MRRTEAAANKDVSLTSFLRNSIRLRVLLCTLAALAVGVSAALLIGHALDRTAFRAESFGERFGLVLFVSLFFSMLLLLALFNVILRPITNLSGRLREVKSGAEVRQLNPEEFIELAPLVEAAIGYIDRAENQQNLAAAIRQASRQRIERMAEMDALTGLHNRFYLQTVLPLKIAQAQGGNDFVSVVMLDVDHFKHYNDANGHLEGDKVLAKVGEILRRSVRHYDVCCRYGGEEFVIILPTANAERAHSIADRIRIAVEKTEFAHGEKQPLGRVTASFGVATFPTHAKAANDLLERADKALYLAKNSGRNGVRAYDDVKKLEVADLDLPETAGSPPRRDGALPVRRVMKSRE